MAPVTEPEAVPGIEARLAETFEEFDAANRVAYDAFGMTEEMRASFDAEQRMLWQLEQRFPDYRTYVALLDGEVVAGAVVTHGANAAFLAGGFTREDMRGRSVYPALVRAR